MLGGAGSPGGDDLLTVTVVRDEHGYGMKVSGEDPVYVQSVKEHGAAWRAGLRSGDRILRVDSVPVHHHTHQQVVHMIRANPSTVLTVQQNSSRHKTPITAPVPVNVSSLYSMLTSTPVISPEKQRQLEVSKVHTVRLMLEQEQKFIRDLRNELLKVPDVRKQAQLESAQQRCSKLQHEIDTIMAGQPGSPGGPSPRAKLPERAPAAQPGGFLSGLPRSLSNLTGQSLRNLRNSRAKQAEPAAGPLVRQNSDDCGRRRPQSQQAAPTVPLVPTTCLDNVTPPPLPPRSTERPKRNPISPSMSPPLNPLAKPKPGHSSQKYYGRYYGDQFAMHQSMHEHRRSSHSLDGDLDADLDGPQPNSIAMQMSYPLVNVPPPPLQTDNRTGVPVLHMRSRSSPEQLDTDLNRSSLVSSPLARTARSPPDSGTPPPGTPPPPYHTNTQILQLSGADENMANEIEHVLVNEYEKEELLRNVFRKARQKAKDELSQQLTEFQVKRQVGLGTLYGPEDSVIDKCDVDKAQLRAVSALPAGAAHAHGPPAHAHAHDAHATLLAALVAAALCLHCRYTATSTSS
ncbi:hypothetical protein HF086_010821 [Spodoptera exigua]|uniref:PDZ domain-containing protein n=1 Tax=Spodoptera exigua TaxID=7107 RepID=A0A922M9G2_SPOEX|nr:hypothetical protein HF086_010821 [Spodoptera exigua]